MCTGFVQVSKLKVIFLLRRVIPQLTDQVASVGRNVNICRSACIGVCVCVASPVFRHTEQHMGTRVA